MQPTEIPLAWLNAALESERQDAVITAFEVEDIGAGKGFGATVLRLRLTWNQPTTAPGSVIIKLPPSDPTMLEAIRQQGVLREALFYRDFATDRSLPTPKIFQVDIHEEDFSILMEDLGDISHSQPESNVASLKRSLITIARVHAAFWNHPLSDRPWLKPVADGDARTRQSQVRQIEQAIRRMETSDLNCVDTIECASKLKSLVLKAPETTAMPRPSTLTHGDFHSNNLAFLDNGQVIIFDWQLVAVGTPAMDVANLLASSLDPNHYARASESLLRTYHEALITQGVDNYSLQQFRRGYKDALFFTFLKFLVILGTINSEVEGGEELLRELITRLNALAINSDARTYCQRLPLLFQLMNLINFVRRFTA